ncbi:MAG: hypothetical protein AB2A00_09015 [Myxococcota bacterium]
MMSVLFLVGALAGKVASADLYVFNVQEKDGVLTELPEGEAGWCEAGSNKKGKLCPSARKVATLEARTARLLEGTLKQKRAFKPGKTSSCWKPRYLVVFHGPKRKKQGEVSVSLECQRVVGKLGKKPLKQHALSVATTELFRATFEETGAPKIAPLKVEQPRLHKLELHTNAAYVVSLDGQPLPSRDHRPGVYLLETLGAEHVVEFKSAQAQCRHRLTLGPGENVIHMANPCGEAVPASAQPTAAVQAPASPAPVAPAMAVAPPTAVAPPPSTEAPPEAVAEDEGEWLPWTPPSAVAPGEAAP